MLTTSKSLEVPPLGYQKPETLCFSCFLPGDGQRPDQPKGGKGTITNTFETYFIMLFSTALQNAQGTNHFDHV
jgi:hypothetical protein